MATPEEDADEPENYYARCPDCEFLETELTEKATRSHQKNGCPNCRDSRGVGVSTMDNLPE